MSRGKEVRKTPGRDDLPLERVAVFRNEMPRKKLRGKNLGCDNLPSERAEVCQDVRGKRNGKNPGCVGLLLMRAAVY
jgi:hypothetical protein